MNIVMYKITCISKSEYKITEYSKIEIMKVLKVMLRFKLDIWRGRLRIPIFGEAHRGKLRLMNHVQL
jgi:hypothetical protein